MSDKKRKGYIYVEVEESVRVYVSDFLDEIEDEDLIDEVRKRNLLHIPDPEIKKKENKFDLFRHLCDLAESNYHVSKIDLFNRLNEKL
jgi:hypothetical protein